MGWLVVPQVCECCVGALQVGFTLSRSRVNGVLSYTAEETETCPLTIAKFTGTEPLVLFLIDVYTLSVSVRAMGDQDNLLIARPKAEAPKGLRKTREVSGPVPAGPPRTPSTRGGGAQVPDHQEPDHQEPDHQVTQKDQDAATQSPENKSDPAGDALTVKENEFQVRGVGAGPDLWSGAVSDPRVFQLEKMKQVTLALDKVNGSYNFSVSTFLEH
ncbi:Protein GPR108 [Liparis tanakae]|uniref:Protein GPR108 n=1 Tax=Liparis tanakae TaxID=230148 RepID=A0A4Z2E282_9TELE|nr:Protein GPR108 [Liparis tanakae]